MAEETQNADLQAAESKAEGMAALGALSGDAPAEAAPQVPACLLYTSPSPRDLSTSRMPSSA